MEANRKTTWNVKNIKVKEVASLDISNLKMRLVNISWDRHKRHKTKMGQKPKFNARCKNNDHIS